MEGIEIRTSRLVLKPLGTGYITTVNEYALDPENTKYMCHLPNANSEETLCFLQNVEAEEERKKLERQIQNSKIDDAELNKLAESIRKIR